MGDRGNIKFVGTGPSPIYFYTHYEGSELDAILRRGLDNGRNRWNDAQYLARIVFCAMVVDNVDGETGYGISTQLYDNEHPILVVDAINGKVYRETESGARRDDREWTFAEFLAGTAANESEVTGDEE